MLRVIDTLIGKIEKEMGEQTVENMSVDFLETNKLLEENWLNLVEIKCAIKKWGGDHEETDKKCRLTNDDIRTWNDNMVNSDGSKGGHWTVEQTTELATSLGVCFEHFTAEEWNVTCNMIYSDYAIVIRAAGVESAKTYGAMAKAFLIDIDGGMPCEKLCRYYKYVVKH